MAAFQQEERRIAASLSRTSRTNSIFDDMHRIMVLFLFVIATLTVALYVSMMHGSALHGGGVTDVNTNLRQNSSPSDSNTDISSSTRKESPSAHTRLLISIPEVGSLRINLRPDLSPESVAYVESLTEDKCEECKFYRAEKPGILQGIMKSHNTEAIQRVAKGGCPSGYETVRNDCPSWDKECGCHGPVMSRGMVGWAGGGTGPDFFIDTYPKDATFWGTQHTVFGEITDDESFHVIEKVWEKPVRKQGSMTMIEHPLHFRVALE